MMVCVEVIVTLILMFYRKPHGPQEEIGDRQDSHL